MYLPTPLPPDAEVVYSAWRPEESTANTKPDPDEHWRRHRQAASSGHAVQFADTPDIAEDAYVELTAYTDPDTGNPATGIRTHVDTDVEELVKFSDVDSAWTAFGSIMRFLGRMPDGPPAQPAHG